MFRTIRSVFSLIIVIALILICVPAVLAVNTDLTYKEYLALSTDEQIAFRNQFASTAEFKQWYLNAKKTYDDSQNKVTVGDGNTVDLGEILNPALGSGICGDALTWSLSQSGILTITGSGNMFDYPNSDAPWNELAQEIKKIEFPIELTSVGVNAFSSCSSITDTYYSGTAYQWSTNVNVASGNDNLTNATAHYAKAILTEISIKSLPSKLQYEIGEELETAGLVITLTYNDGFSEDIDAGFQVTDLDSSSTGVKTITVTYLEKTTIFNVSVIASPSGISINSLPDKDNYWVGDVLDTTGLALNLNYTDGTTEVITGGYTVTGFDSTTPGTIELTVTYLGFETTFNVNINAITVTDILVLTPPTTTKYWVGSELDTSGLSLQVNYSNGSSETIYSGFEISNFDSSVEDTVEVTVTYQGASATFEIVISDEGRCGETLSWYINDEGILIISGTGRMYDYLPGSAPWYGNEINGVKFSPEVTYLGNYAFGGATYISTFTIPVNMSVGVGTFANCPNLTGIAFDDEHPLYYTDANGALFSSDKSVLIQVPGAYSGNFSIPSTVSIISEAAFYGCAKLTGVTFIGTSSISGGFTDRDAASAEVSTGSVEFGTNNVTEIGKYAFKDCVKLTAINIPTQVSVIDTGTFEGCEKLSFVFIPKSITAINDSAFAGCDCLSDITYTGRHTVSATSTAAAWNKIVIGDNNDSLNTASFIYAGEVRVSSAALFLQNNIAIHYKVKKTVVETYGFSNLKLVFTFNGVTTTMTEYGENDDEYIFYFKNIAPNQMNDTIVCTLYATKDGKTYQSTKREFSVATYCYSQLEDYNSDTYAKFRTLLVDLLNYGAAAQNYTGYKTDELVNANLTALQSSWGSSNTPALTDYTNTKHDTIENPTVKWKGAGLYLQDSVTMRYKIEASDISNLTAVFTCDGYSWSIPASQFVPTEDANKYYIYFNKLHPGQMRSLVYVTIYDGTTPVSNSLRYSIESYAADPPTTDDPQLTALLTAMMRYGDSANNYVK